MPGLTFAGSIIQHCAAHIVAGAFIAPFYRTHNRITPLATPGAHIPRIRSSRVSIAASAPLPPPAYYAAAAVSHAINAFPRFNAARAPLPGIINRQFQRRAWLCHRAIYHRYTLPHNKFTPQPVRSTCESAIRSPQSTSFSRHIIATSLRVPATYTQRRICRPHSIIAALDPH